MGGDESIHAGSLSPLALLWTTSDHEGKRAGYAVSSIRRYLSTIRQYCRLSYQSGTISSDEWTRIAAVKADSRAEGANIDTEREKKGIHPRITTKKEYATHLDA